MARQQHSYNKGLVNKGRANVFNERVACPVHLRTKITGASTFGSWILSLLWLCVVSLRLWFKDGRKDRMRPLSKAHRTRGNKLRWCFVVPVEARTICLIVSRTSVMIRRNQIQTMKCGQFIWIQLIFNEKSVELNQVEPLMRAQHWNLNKFNLHKSCVMKQAAFKTKVFEIIEKPLNWTWRRKSQRSTDANR